MQSNSKRKETQSNYFYGRLLLHEPGVKKKRVRETHMSVKVQQGQKRGETEKLNAA